MECERTMSETVPGAKSARSPDEREKLRRIAVQRRLCGLANDTKWDELIEAVRARTDWRPSYRCKCIDGPPSGWDVEWFYHLPFPMLSVEWLDVYIIQEVPLHRLPARMDVIDHSVWIEELLERIGLDHCKGTKMIRVYGYSPRGTELFDE